MGESGGHESMIPSKKTNTVERRPGEIIGHFFTKLTRQHAVNVVMGRLRKIRLRATHAANATICILEG
jgi:hypothetical protein